MAAKKSRKETAVLEKKNHRVKRSLKRRYLSEKVFKGLGLISVLTVAAFLFILLGHIVKEGASGFFQSWIEIKITMSATAGLTETDSGTLILKQEDTPRFLLKALRAHLYPATQETETQVMTRTDERNLLKLFSTGVRPQLQSFILENQHYKGQTVTLNLLASDDVDQAIKGKIKLRVKEEERRLTDKQVNWLQQFQANGQIKSYFNLPFLTGSVSTEPELAGIGGAVTGSALTLFITLVFAFPIGVLTAIFLEEFAGTSPFTDFIEININNLAAVPSIVFGLLGLTFFIGTLDLPRSTPLVGGLTLALMTLPTIVITSRSAIRSVSKDLREAAIGLGASPMQVAFHHIVPAAMPGIMTGTIIGMAQALGETAPLLMIGMVAFIIDIPAHVSEAATVLPVQIFLWADSPERAFREKTAAAIIVLLVFLVIMNALAIWLRQRFENGKRFESEHKIINGGAE